MLLVTGHVSGFATLASMNAGATQTISLSVVPLPIADVTIGLAAPGLIFQPPSIAFTSSGPVSSPCQITVEPSALTTSGLPISVVFSGTDARFYTVPAVTVSIVGNFQGSLQFIEQR